MNRNEFVVFDYLYDEDADNLTDEVETSVSRRGLLPMYIYDILKSVSSPSHKITHEELIARLDSFPYSLSVERKAVGRSIKMLALENIGIHTSYNGSWYEHSSYAA